MISISWSYFVVYVFTLVSIIFSPRMFKSMDEVCILLFILLIALDMIVNRNIKRYRALIITEIVMGFYAIYSIFVTKFNPASSVLTDFVIEQKPMMLLFATLAIAPRLNKKMRQLLQVIAVALVTVVFVIFLANYTTRLLVHHYVIGVVAFNSAMVYLMASVEDDGTIKMKHLYPIAYFLLVGLCSGRSKYYGELVVLLFMLFVYRPGFLKHLTLNHVLMIVLGGAVLLAVVWNKLDYYFLSSSTDMALSAVGDASHDDEFARPAMYLGMLLIMADYFPFGSGLASFATYSSAHPHYSSLYSQYGLDKVWGLSPSYSDFVCDAYYASLAQFGVVGMILFVAVLVWAFRRLSLVLHCEGKLKYVVGVMSLVFVIIESTTGTAFTQSSGQFAMMTVGLLLCRYHYVTKAERKEILNMPYEESEKAMKIVTNIEE